MTIVFLKDLVSTAVSSSNRNTIEGCPGRGIAALAACWGNWAAAARRLAVDPSNLHKLARRLAIKR